MRSYDWITASTTPRATSAFAPKTLLKRSESFEADPRFVQTMFADPTAGVATGDVVDGPDSPGSRFAVAPISTGVVNSSGPSQSMRRVSSDSKVGKRRRFRVLG